jgi:hypothetical protein
MSGKSGSARVTPFTQESRILDSMLGMIPGSFSGIKNIDLTSCDEIMAIGFN